MIFMIRVSRLTGIVLLLLGGIIGVRFFSLRRIFGSFTSKKIFPGTERVRLILSGGRESKMGLRETKGYIDSATKRNETFQLSIMTQRKRNYCDIKKKVNFHFP